MEDPMGTICKERRSQALALGCFEPGGMGWTFGCGRHNVTSRTSSEQKEKVWAKIYNLIPCPFSVLYLRKRVSLTPTDWLYLPKSHCGAGIVNGGATKWDEAVGGRGRGGGGAPMGLPFRLAPLSPHVLNAHTPKANFNCAPSGRFCVWFEILWCTRIFFFTSCLWEKAAITSPHSAQALPSWPSWARRYHSQEVCDGVRNSAFFLTQSHTHRHNRKGPPTSKGSSPKTEGNICSRLRTVTRLCLGTWIIYDQSDWPLKIVRSYHTA